MGSPRPATRIRSEGEDREQAAARRLELLAADLGVGASRDPAGGDAVAERRPASGVPRVAPPWEEPATPGETATGLPDVGRHAARRRVALLTVPQLPGLGVGHVAVLALIVTVALAGTAWWLLRDRAEPISAAGAPSAGAGAPADDAAPLVPATSEGSQETTVTVDVAGKVRRPGIVVLDHGARVVDALEAAGGAKKAVDTSTINLARVLVDGEQIVVGADVAAAAPPPAAAGAAGGGPLVNLNLADAAELETLPGVGPVTAAAIIEWREQNGGFGSVDQLMDVSGIGEKTLEQIEPRATV